MIKPNELRKKSDKELESMLKDIEYNLILASSEWSRNLISKKETGMKGIAKQGEKTSMFRDLRRLKAKILTILNERRIANGNN